MKAITLVKNGIAKSAFEKQEHPTPTPKDGEVLIEVEAFGLNFADVLARLGLLQRGSSYSFCVGIRSSWYS